MKRYLKFVVLFFILFLGTACGHTEKSMEEIPMLNVELKVNPEKANPNEMVTFEANVTYGDEEVTNANKVSFEIWRANDKHEKVIINHEKDGIYQLEKSFSAEGTYYVISHVTARDMHSMPRKQFTVGKPSEPEKNKTTGMEKKDSEGEHSTH
jgi:hypothetical protein